MIFYAELLGADRDLLDAYDGLTTVMLTRRLSPLDDDGEWIEPVAIDAQLHDASVQRSLMDALRYQLDGFDYEYLGLTATTDSAATPHEHLLVWIDDPCDDVGVDHFRPALEKHVEGLPLADADDHPVHADGDEGAITIQHTPTLVDHYDLSFGGATSVSTAAAEYLATQLPHLTLADVYDGSCDVGRVHVDGDAIAWASPHRWLRSSSGISL